MRKLYLLKDNDWRWDAMPEIWEGKNVVGISIYLHILVDVALCRRYGGVGGEERGRHLYLSTHLGRCGRMGGEGKVVGIHLSFFLGMGVHASY